MLALSVAENTQRDILNIARFAGKSPSNGSDVTKLLLKQPANILSRQSLGKTIGLIHHGRDQLPFGVLQGHNLFLNGSLSNHAIDHHLTGLSDAVCAVNGLSLYGRVPPWIKKEAVISLGQVQTETTGFQRDQEQWSFAVLELLDYLGAVSSIAVKIYT